MTLKSIPTSGFRCNKYGSLFWRPLHDGKILSSRREESGSDLSPLEKEARIDLFLRREKSWGNNFSILEKSDSKSDRGNWAFCPYFYMAHRGPWRPTDGPSPFRLGAAMCERGLKAWAQRPRPWKLVREKQRKAFVGMTRSAEKVKGLLGRRGIGRDAVKDRPKVREEIAENDGP